MNLEALLDPQPRKPPTMELSWSAARRIMTLIASEVVLSTPGFLPPRAAVMLDEGTPGAAPGDARRRFASVEGAADAALLFVVEYEPVFPAGAPKMLMLLKLTAGARDPKVSTGDSESCSAID